VIWPFRPRARPTLSACVVAQDAARDLEGLLRNLRGLADEVVVVDGGSRDATREVAIRAGARLIENPWPGHWGRQKNCAFDAARGDWILNVDCDERVGDRLRERIPRLIAARFRSFYKLPMYWLVPAEGGAAVGTAAADGAEKSLWSHSTLAADANIKLTYSQPKNRALDGSGLLFLRTPQHYPCHIPRLFRNLPAHRYVEDTLCHPTFAKPVRRRMTKVRRAHLFHLIFLREGRAAIEAKMARYEAQDPRARATNEKYYPWWRIPHEVARCDESYTE
jgi:glycosyltransferase involved in cell wall biosynthesis